MEQPGKSMWDLTVRDLVDGCRAEMSGGLMMSQLLKGGKEPVGAIIVVLGSDETADVVDAVGRQMEIWKSDQKPARYVDGNGRIVSISNVRSHGVYCAFTRDPETGALTVLALRDVPCKTTFAEAQQGLDAFAEKRKWARVPEPGTVFGALSLVMGNPPDEELIASWSDIDRVRSQQWAMLTHVKASDNPEQKVPPVPNVLFDYVRGAA